MLIPPLVVAFMASVVANWFVHVPPAGGEKSGGFCRQVFLDLAERYGQKRFFVLCGHDVLHHDSACYDRGLFSGIFSDRIRFTGMRSDCFRIFHIGCQKRDGTV